jgi:hypothetical protein
MSNRKSLRHLEMVLRRMKKMEYPKIELDGKDWKRNLIYG